MTSPSDLLAARFQAVAAATEQRLIEALADAPLEGERTRPSHLMAAMRHGSLDGGKRLRPLLVVESAALFGVPLARAITAAAALECVHCYSLIHDDLPAMDNDLLRRGRPTVHVAFGEETAILAGDGLLTLAFDLLAGEDAHPDAQVRIALVRLLARASGIGGMVGGQMLDLAAEGRFSGGTPQALSEADIRTLQAMKTGALLRAGVEMGALLGGADAEARAALAAYGTALGVAFQIADDILDIEGDAAALGKSVGKDAQAGKATLVSALGMERARALLADLVAEAGGALAPFGAQGAVLAEVARFVATRQN
ncbi:polyprenyl synthetase [Azorhizobium caulinodans ORS 571]|uniref:Probable farnesyl diphosphate synthase n=1 Tax=Azorhizobium caulinodans (strain ATCC 43989 / DSM 5975 / JCM 20966 / LMG 6465 / NBRC 14845 / NCIMB 13405 / ORS 571) TaxID=438753 RepID=A8HWN6_AZOC5|nr:polyprenyl synthetase [Azorhizobium caulinodans ORS 571]